MPKAYRIAQIEIETPIGWVFQLAILNTDPAIYAASAMAYRRREFPASNFRLVPVARKEGN